ncbi:MAG: flavodoxin [Marinilabiliales bacterium]|nr:MAG: flavodoxin [Marinilabiliales bacterium]
MKKIALIYSFNTTKSKNAAKKIIAEIGEDKIDSLNAEEITGEEFLKYDKYILSLPTWFDGELPNYWDEFVPELEDLPLKGKTFALFGLGDQKNYAENFGDAVGIMAEIIEQAGGKIIGSTEVEGYTFENSKALRDGKFVGLLLDQDNQAKLSGKRIKDWVASIGQLLLK